MLSRLGRLSVLCLHLNLFSPLVGVRLGQNVVCGSFYCFQNSVSIFVSERERSRFIHCVLSVGVGGVPAYFRREGLQ